MYSLVEIVKDIDRAARCHLLTPLEDGLLFRLVYTCWIDTIRYPLCTSVVDRVAYAAELLDHSSPVRLRNKDRLSYMKGSRKVCLDLKAKGIKSMLQLRHKDGTMPSRAYRVRCIVDEYLRKFRTAMNLSPQTDVTTYVGRHCMQTVAATKHRSPLDKHLRFVAIDNGFAEGPVALDDILPDISGLLK